MNNTRTLTCTDSDVHSLELSDDGRTLTYITNDGDQLVEQTHKFRHIRHGPEDTETFSDDQSIPASNGEITHVDLSGNPWLGVEDPDGNEHLHVYDRGRTRTV